MLELKGGSAIQMQWAIFCLLCLVLTTQNSLSMAAAALPSLSSTDDQSSSSSCQQCLARGMLAIPACSVTATAPAFPETETDPAQIQVFKNLYPMAVECLCIANATALLRSTTQVIETAGSGTLVITGWVDLCDDQCSVSMVKAQIRTLAVLSSLMGCNGTAPGLEPGSSTGTTVRATEFTPPTATTKTTKTAKKTITVAVPKASFHPSKSVGTKKVPKKSSRAVV